MKKALLTLGLFIGVLVYGQETTKDIKDIGIYKAAVYHENGKIAQTGFMTTDKEVHGVWKSFDTDGNLTSLGEYDHGKKVGVWIFWKTSYADKFNYTKVEFGADNTIAEAYDSKDYLQIADTDTEIED